MVKFLIPDLAISDREGFDGDKDIFQRKKFADGLTNLVTQITDPMVLAIDGNWGTGKTVFLKMWAGELRESGFLVAYFDAFENDYMDDAFLAITGKIFSLIKEKCGEQKETATNYKKWAAKVAKIIAVFGVKALTGSAVSTLDLGEVAREAVKAGADTLNAETSAALDRYIGQMITGQQQQQDAIKKFRDTLSGLSAALQPSDNENAKPLLFIIDELDRCRPTFALEILERIKHFFNVPNVHFILGCNTDQLQSAVKSVYGPDIDALSYLRKFIHVNIPVPEQTTSDQYMAGKKYVYYLRDEMELGSCVGHIMAETIADAAERLRLDLRTIERIMTVVALYIAHRPKANSMLGPVYASLCILKVTAPHILDSIKSKNWKFADIQNRLMLDDNQSVADDDPDLWSLSVMLKYLSGDELADYEKNTPFIRQFNCHLSGSPRQLLTSFADRLLDRFHGG